MCDILRMANSSGLTDVTEHCMVYFQRHKSQIFTTESYARFKESEPTLGMKILEEMHSREPIGWYWANPKLCPTEKMDGEKKDGDDKVATELERRRSHGGEGIAVQSMGTSSDDSDDNDDDDDDLDDLDDDEVEL